MTRILYHGEPNGPSLAILAAAFEKQVDLTLERIDLVAGERHAAGIGHSHSLRLGRKWPFSHSLPRPLIAIRTSS